MLPRFQFALLFALVLSLASIRFVDAQSNESRAKWHRGNLHTHSLWSDGNDFPDMIVKWYADNGYQFLALTDHNVMSIGPRWMKWELIKKRSNEKALSRYVQAFGKDWVETRGSEAEGTLEVRLKNYSDCRQRFDKSGKFLLMTGEEISDSVNGFPLHLNATNLKTLLRPTGGSSIREAMTRNLRAAQEQAVKEDRDVLVHLNHPNFGWAITAEDLAAVTLEKFVEVYNGHPSVNHLGNKDRASVERIWDIANTIRIAELDATPLFGLATDDSHNYHGKPGSHTGRGWIMVRSTELSSKEILKAIQRGDFYASSGVEFEKVDYDNKAKRIALEIKPEKGVEYETQFIGTLKGYDKTSKPSVAADGKVIRTTRIYSDEVGQVLATVKGLTPTYTLTGKEHYVRAVVTSSKAHPDPSFKNQKEQAWTQPVGWRK